MCVETHPPLYWYNQSDKMIVDPINAPHNILYVNTQYIIISMMAVVVGD